MVNNEPLIPPPSIGESRESKAALPPKKKSGSKLWLVVLTCVVVGVGLGVVVYQKSIAPTTRPTPTPRPSVAPRPSPIPSPSVAVPDVSAITPQSNKISFPKGGQVRVYYSNYEGTAKTLIDMESVSGGVGMQMTGNGSGTTMAYKDTGFVLPGPEQVTISLYDGASYDTPATGWIPPTGNICGADPYAKPDITPYINWVTEQSEGEPLVSVQCWGDWGKSGDPSNYDYNDYLVIWSYTPASAITSPSPSSSATASASPSPSSSATASVSPFPSATATATATPTPTPSTTAAVSPSARAAMPEGSALPDAGVFEVTVGTVSVGLLLLVLGLLGLLVL